MLYDGDDILQLFVKALKEKDKVKDEKKKPEKRKKCECCSCESKKKKKKKGPTVVEQLAVATFMAPFVLALPFVFNTFNMIFVYSASLYLQYAEWSLNTMKALH